MSIQKKILVVGGSGFLSGSVVRAALERKNQVWTVTRGQRPLPDGINPLIVDRSDRQAFKTVIEESGQTWDLVVDCIGYEPEDAQQDIAVLGPRCSHMVFISTDFVYDPKYRRFPQDEQGERYLKDGYGGKKRLCEIEFIERAPRDLSWTIVRPGHIYGPGSLLGCLPEHSRDADLIAHLQSGKALKLVGGGYFLQQPIYAPDLAELCLDLAGHRNTFQQVFCTAGPDVIESRTYYEIIAEHVGGKARIEEIPVDPYLADNPDAFMFLCHRFYDLSKLKSTRVKLPATSIRQGLKEHIQSLLS